MDKKKLIEELINTAAQSTSTKRKVAAIVMDTFNGEIIARGFNHVFDDPNQPCEVDIYGKPHTREDVIHAEMDAINKLKYVYTNEDIVMFISYQPCINCRAALQRIGLKYKVVKDEGDL